MNNVTVNHVTVEPEEQIESIPSTMVSADIGATPWPAGVDRPVDDELDDATAGQLEAYRTNMMLVTPTIARIWLETSQYPRQRPINQKHVNNLANAIRANQFKSGTIEFRSLGDGKFLLIDGQHRLSAIVAANRPVLLNVLTRTVETQDEIDMDYARTDRGSARTLGQAFLAAGTAEKLALTSPQLRSVSSATAHMSRAFLAVAPQYNTLATVDQRIEAVEHWAVEARQYFTCIRRASGGLARGLTNGVTVGIGLLILRHQPDRASEFLQQVAANDGLRSGTPEQALVSYLIETRAVTRGNSGYARAVATCWNAYFEGRGLNWVRSVDATSPLRLAGTPYNGIEHRPLVGGIEEVEVTT